jgi:glycosyltransferase involved in cell wall biosynthesis
MPKVSVTIASFNHEKYIRECLQSVLDQTYQDFEIIVTDDGSSDRSAEVIKEFSDPRIKLYTYGENKGACTALNHCIQKASGEYIAVLNSDDAWNPTKLAKQVTFLDSHPEMGAVFSRVQFVNEHSQLLSPLNYAHYYVFERNNMTRYAFLNLFFSGVNCLCHPSIMIRKKCYDQIGLYDERMANLPDLDMWVKLCLRFEIHILEEKLIRFRVLKNEANASGNTVPIRTRCRFEFKQILNHFLDIKDKETILRIFPEASKYGRIENEYIPFFLGMLALDAPDNVCHLWGLEVLYNFIGNDAISQGLELNYKFRYRDFHKLTARYDVIRSFSKINTSQNTHPGRNILLRAAIRLHWTLENLARRYILR